MVAALAEGFWEEAAVFTSQASAVEPEDFEEAVDLFGDAVLEAFLLEAGGEVVDVEGVGVAYGCIRGEFLEEPQEGAFHLAEDLEGFFRTVGDPMP